jgi:glycine dehydrogenase subunit 1
MLAYIPNTNEQQQEMLQEIGVENINKLFSDIPEECKLNRKLNVPEGKSEMEIRDCIRQVAKQNNNISENICFLGAGAYDHYIPSVIDYLAGRQEFYTAYTPYQPEISQGTLKAIFEFQTYICELTGMDVANASMYDGASTLAESCIMASSTTRRNTILIAKTVHPEYREVVKTYAKFRGLKVYETDYTDGVTDIKQLHEMLSDDIAAFVLQTPNFFGLIEEIDSICNIIHENKSLMIACCDPISLGIMKPPGDLGVDIVVGEGQSLGNHLSFGGPYLGFMAAKNKLMRKMPGRIVGQTQDVDGKTAYVLTLQAREQHIRREKATSNICSNQALNALRATVYISLLGKQGYKKVSEMCIQKSHYTYNELLKLDGIEQCFNKPFFKEFVVKIKGSVDKINYKLNKINIIGGYNLGNSYPELENCWLIAVTEKRTKAQIDKFVKKVGEFINE